MKRIAPGKVTVRGIDVSHYQSKVDFTLVKASGHEFAIIKASEGETVKDKLYKSHVKAARAAGILVSSYHFFRPSLDPYKQAQNFLNAVLPFAVGDLPPVLDIEWADGLKKLNRQGADGAIAWLERVEEATGATPFVYTAASFFEGAPGSERFKRFPLWVANYGAKAPMVPEPWKKWTMWQFTDHEDVKGAGRIDGNLFNGSLADLHALAGKQLVKA